MTERLILGDCKLNSGLSQRDGNVLEESFFLCEKVHINAAAVCRTGD